MMAVSAKDWLYPFTGYPTADLRLLDVIQEIAGKDGRMASEMAERAVKTLQSLANGQEVSEADIEHTKKLLEYVSEGTLVLVQRLQEH